MDVSPLRQGEEVKNACEMVFVQEQKTPPSCAHDAYPSQQLLSPVSFEGRQLQEDFEDYLSPTYMAQEPITR